MINDDYIGAPSADPDEPTQPEQEAPVKPPKKKYVDKRRLTKAKDEKLFNPTLNKNWLC